MRAKGRERVEEGARKTVNDIFRPQKVVRCCHLVVPWRPIRFKARLREVSGRKLSDLDEIVVHLS